nr:metallophosphoesterase [Candidatus Sigynarchaeota archaeon]
MKTGIILACFAAAGVYMVFTVDSNAAAAIVYPRFGCPLRGPFSPGPGMNTSDYLDETLTVWVAPDPAENPIPLQWLDKSNWNVALVPAVIPNASCISLLVESVATGMNSMVLFGGTMDVNPIAPTALGITCKVPADIVPVTFHLAIGFKTAITPPLQQNGDIDLVPRLNSWRGLAGSASANWLTGNRPFVITERNAVSIPWIRDARSSDDFKEFGGKSVKPFTIMHVTDTHYHTGAEWLVNDALWENDSDVIAPDVILLTGDLMENPGDELTGSASQYNLAFNHLSALHTPIVMVSGNHDNRNLGLWKIFFGPLFSSTRFDDVKVVAFDSSLPIGSGVLNWIDQESRSVVPNGPTFLMCHYNIDPSYLQSAWVGVSEMMITKNMTAIFVGHTHGDLVGGVARLRDALVNNAGALIDGSEHEIIHVLEGALETTNQTTTYLDPIREPQILMTRAAKDGYNITSVNNFTSAQLRYAGYRIVTIKQNLASNYTYDLDGDSVREPQVSYPSGLFRVARSINATGMTWVLNNTGNEHLPAARATFLLPNPPEGQHWDLIPGNLTSAYIRARVTNGTHWWIDARVPSPARRVVTLKIEAQA